MTTNSQQPHSVTLVTKKTLKGETYPVLHIATFYSDETYTGSNYRHMFGLFTCIPNESWRFKPNDEVHRIFPMSIKDIVRQMNDSPQTFTPGFLNTMEEYLKIIKSDLPLDLSHYKNHIP